MARIQFKSGRADATDAIVASFDVGGFSELCNRDDADTVIPKFLAGLFEELNTFLMSGWAAAFENMGELLGSRKERRKVVTPQYIKFTGDGAIMIWFPGIDGKFSDVFCTTVVKTMRNLQTRLAVSVAAWEKEWRVVSLPSRTRFGITAGRVYGLTDPDTDMTGEYVGYCVNLAVRLQNHCPEAGFLVHQTLHPAIDGLVKLEALGMKGTRPEPVLAFESDLQGLKDNYFRTKFRRV